MHVDPRRRPTDRTSHGFTLVRFLVVIGIIAVLVALLLPVLTRARAASNAIACVSNLRQLRAAITMYAQQKPHYLPFGDVQGGGVMPGRVRRPRH